MTKRKIERFAEMEQFANVIQVSLKEHLIEDHPLKGTWNAEVFKNNNPIVLELGCGKGEYTVGLARLRPYFNFIGIDIKGARIWRGAKTAIQENLQNVIFLRTKVDLIEAFFAADEISEIWIPFADPQPEKQRKRLTSAAFMNKYRRICKNNATLNLKTDSPLLYAYTKALCEFNCITPDILIDDVYATNSNDPILSIKTFYEHQHLKAGKKIHYLRSEIFKHQNMQELPFKFTFEVHDDLELKTEI